MGYLNEYDEITSWKLTHAARPEEHGHTLHHGRNIDLQPDHVISN